MKQIVAFLVVCSIFISCSDKKRVVEEENLNFEILSIDDLTIGEVIDLAYYRANKNEERNERAKDDRRKATQADYDAF